MELRFTWQNETNTALDLSLFITGANINYQASLHGSDIEESRQGICLSATVHLPEALLPQNLLLQTFNLGCQPRVISLQLIILRSLHRQ